MSDEDWQGIRSVPAHVNEVNPEALNFGLEVRQLPQSASCRRQSKWFNQ